MSNTPICKNKKCKNRTKHHSGLCHHHRAGTVRYTAYGQKCYEDSNSKDITEKAKIELKSPPTSKTMYPGSPYFTIEMLEKLSLWIRTQDQKNVIDYDEARTLYPTTIETIKGKDLNGSVVGIFTESGELLTTSPHPIHFGYLNVLEEDTEQKAILYRTYNNSLLSIMNEKEYKVLKLSDEIIEEAQWNDR